MHALPSVGFNKHPIEDALEAYIMWTLPDAEIGPLEQHLISCWLCELRLAETDEFITATRAAAARSLSPPEPEIRRSRKFIHDTEDELIVLEVTRDEPP